MDRERKTTAVERADRKITSKVNDERDSWPVRLMGAASEIGDQPEMRTICAATIALGIARRDRHLTGAGVRMLAAHTLATWTKSRIKAVIDRRRPKNGDDPRVRRGDSDRHEENSFPSGHSAGAVAVGEAMARAYPDHSLAARGAALAVSVVQVPRGTHYASDVVAGIAIGLIAERASDAAIDLAVRWTRRELAKRQRGIGGAATPIIRPAGAPPSPRMPQDRTDAVSARSALYSPELIALARP
ncbi:phosphatase PAP2 family protein [Sphingomonas sp. GM_Shp_1]|uniref:phosphatase PAP2 family protein n=1 Tax=Sphingomonas sp. GM_Shp_1 TaxID=2937381 RepID=UPI00226B4A7E|nr:phosphatase PAP2 family protein [Sphingomonas sp. GM_Shp_1]